MYLIVFTVTALLIQSAEGDCLDGVKQCTSKYFSVVAENLFNMDMVCLSTKDFIKCVYMQNCFTSQTEKLQFYQSIDERLNNNFRYCGFTAQQVINAFVSKTDYSFYARMH
ncbi:hypothetical protein Btru_043108 [Bulinus truncatus]|nr:hypothetical protein Btru_043108 [Bulinus truncatus]